MRSILPFLSILPFAAAAPLLQPQNVELIPGKYIVVLRPDAPDGALANLTNLMGEDATDYIYTIGSFRAAAGSLSRGLMNTVQQLPHVAYIEHDAVVRTAALVTQRNAPWGLARISHRSNGSTDYVYDNSAGTSTCAYVIDTGIDTSHPDFGGRATFLRNFADDGLDDDGNGHGTHVAGIVGSTTFGVAKNTMLFGVKVLDSNGTGANSGVLAGIHFAADDAKNRVRVGQCSKGSVGNLSLGGSFSTAQMEAVRAAVDSGLFMAVAAGNNGLPDVLFSPANEVSACTVGATDKNDKMAAFSNYGPLVDVLAPGVAIKSTWLNGKVNTISGTSMAAPHVAGLGAYLLGLEQRRDPRALCKRIQDLATKKRISNVGFLTRNYLTYNGNGA